MKNLFLRLLLIIGAVPACVQGQNWNLIAPQSSLNYQAEGAAFITTNLYPLQTSVSGSDSIFLMPVQGVFLPSYPYITQIGSIMGDTVVKHVDSEYEFRFKPVFDYPYPLGKFTIRAFAEPGESWAYGTGINATVTVKKDTVIWGIADSVKTILLSDGKQILLSKKFGLLSFNKNKLVGLQGKNIGLQLPKSGQFYADWKPEAMFESSGVSVSNYSSTTKTWTLYQVVNKFYAGDSLKVKVSKYVRREHYSLGVQINTTFENTTETLNLGSINTIWRPGLTTPGFGPSVQTYYEPSPEGLTLIIENVITPASGGAIRKEKYRLGLGNIYDQLAYGSIDYTFSSETSLTGYKRVGENIVGEIHPYEFYGLLNAEDASADYGIALYPNPVTGIAVNLDYGQAAVDRVEWFDAGGRLVKTLLAPARKEAISVEDLGSGVYFLRFYMSDGKTVNGKLFIP